MPGTVRVKGDNTANRNQTKRKYKSAKEELIAEKYTKLERPKLIGKIDEGYRSLKNNFRVKSRTSHNVNNKGIPYNKVKNKANRWM